MTERNYAHLSLAYIRQVTGKPIPTAPSVKALVKDIEKRGDENARARLVKREPKVGDIMIWPTVGSHGDCTLYLGDRSILMMQRSGRPLIGRLDYYAPATFLILEL
jgi:hypothetical protein